MADISLIRDEIAEAISVIEIGGDVVQIESYRSDQIQTPAAVIEPDRVAFDTTFARGHDAWFMNLRFLVSSASNSDGLKLRDELFMNASDVKNAIEDHIVLQDGTVAQSTYVRSARNFGVWEVSSIAYIGVEFTVEIIA